MAPRGSRPALLLPLALLVACLALASGRLHNPEFEKFLRKHWDYPKSPSRDPNAYCDRLMAERGIFGKPKHVFILEPIPKIVDVCRGAGKPIGGGWFRSIKIFDIIECTLITPKGPYSGHRFLPKIIIRCMCGFPVDVDVCLKGSHWGVKGHGEQCDSESWSAPSTLYTAPDSSSASASDAFSAFSSAPDTSAAFSSAPDTSSSSEHWAEDSDVPSAASGSHCGE